MSISLNISMDNAERHHEKSRLDNILPQNQELINNLNLKIDRRINNGYYYQVDAKRKTLPIPSRYKFQPKLKLKKVHPVYKKTKKLSNSDEIQMKGQSLSTNSKTQIKLNYTKNGKIRQVNMYSSNQIQFWRMNKCNFLVKLLKYNKEISRCNGQLNLFHIRMKQFGILYKAKLYLYSVEMHQFSIRLKSLSLNPKLKQFTKMQKLSVKR